MTRNREQWRPFCDRCGADFSSTAHTMSRFNTDTICTQCAEDEQAAPGYDRAVSAEIAAVKRGEMNYPGVGLTAEDAAFLRKRRETRRGEVDDGP